MKPRRSSMWVLISTKFSCYLSLPFFFSFTVVTMIPGLCSRMCLLYLGMYNIYVYAGYDSTHGRPGIAWAVCWEDVCRGSYPIYTLLCEIIWILGTCWNFVHHSVISMISVRPTVTEPLIYCLVSSKASAVARIR